jgi:DNA (cytosine-5)-methyltransferase 1
MGASKQKHFSVADLFCGAGGVALGLRAAGFDIRWAADSAAAAVATYRRNVGDHVHESELCADSEIPPVDVIAGGPPCQGFSSAGMRRDGDSRNGLVKVFADLVAKVRPTVFIFENVEGFLTGETGHRVIDLLEPLVAAGYAIHLRKINAANYGVPQHRKRVLAIGGLGFDPGFPSPSHRAVGAPGADLIGHSLPRCPGVLEALRGLPEAVCASGAQTPEDDHYFRESSEADLRRIEALKPGETMKDLPEELWHETFRRRAFRRVMDGTPTERRGGAPFGMRRLLGEEPSKAITSGATSEFVHPTETRNLTLRECARLQTFPDSFVFCGSRAQRALLIGNAVPPRLAEAIGNHLTAVLSNKKSQRPAKGVLSFVPTNSSGMSPALAKTSRMVRDRFGDGQGERQLLLCD